MYIVLVVMAKQLGLNLEKKNNLFFIKNENNQIIKLIKTAICPGISVPNSDNLLNFARKKELLILKKH